MKQRLKKKSAKGLYRQGENHFGEFFSILTSGLWRPPVAVCLRLLIAVSVAGLVFGCTAESRKARLAKRADDYFKAGDYNKAKIEYLGLLRLNPENKTAFERIGLIWAEQGAPLRAGPFLLKARDLSPDDLDNRMRLGRVFLALGDAASARKEALYILSKSPGYDDAIVLLSECDRTKEDAAATELQLKKFPDHNKSAYFLASANVEFHKQDLAAARTALQRASEVDPKSATPHLAYAALLLLTKDNPKAGEELKKAADLAPPRSIAHVRLAEFKAQTGAVAEAKQILKGVTDKVPDFLPAWLLTAKIALTEKKYDEANSLLENVLSQDAENIDARVLQAQISIGKGDVAKATETMEHLSKAYPTVPAFSYQLALIYLQQNKLEPAAGVLKQAITKNPDFADAIVLLAQLNLKTGNAPAAVQALTELLKKRPELTGARLLLAEAHQVTGHLDEAVNILQEHLRSAPQDSQSYFFLGLLFRQQNKNDEARKAFEKVRELTPDNAASLDQLVELDIANKDFNSAMSKAQQELTRAPNAAISHYLVGKVHAAMHSWDQAEAELSRALELDAKFSRAYDGLIAVYVTRGKLPEAANRLEALIAKNPQNTAALLTSAMLYERMKDFDKARNAYEKVLATNPDFTSALNNLAYLYATQFNEPDKALELANKARQLKPEDPAVADTLGWIAYKRGDYARALSLLQQGAAKLSDNAEVQYHLGMANYMMGQTGAAKTALERAANAPADFPDKEDSKRRLALLQEEGAAQVSIEEMKRLLTQQPNDPILLQRIGESYEKEQKFADAASSYEQVIKLNPHLIAPTLKLAQLYAGPLKNPTKALELAKEARELAPGDAQINARAGIIAYQAGDFDWSYSRLQESTQRLPDNAEAQRYFALAAYSRGKIAEAREAMKSVVSKVHDPAQLEDAKSFLSLTSLDQSPSNIAALSAEAEKTLRGDPNNAPALMVQAEANRQRGENKAAADIYNKILQRYPDFGPAQKNLAILYARDPAFLANAYDLATKARKKMPDDLDLMQTMGEISYRKKDYSYAVQLLNDRSRKKPLDAEGLFCLGMSNLQLKKNATARDALQHALQAGLADPSANEAKQALAKLK
jgi:tetratricopeptide (TPR) repeat protein